jgi:hypothetical protein
MMMVMRTTVDIAASVLENARAVATGRGVTVSELLEDALRAYLSSADQAAPVPFHLPTVRGQLVQPGIDLDRSSALVAADDEAAYGKPV